MKPIHLLTLAVALTVTGLARGAELRTSAQVIAPATTKPAETVCHSRTEVKVALGAEHEAVAKQLLLDKVDFNKKMVVVIRSGAGNAFGVQLSLLKVVRAEEGQSATIHWQYKPYFGGAAPPDEPGNPTFAAIVDRIDGPVKFQRSNWRYPSGLPLPPSAPPSRPGIPREK